jgi:hypothetical protein
VLNITLNQPQLLLMETLDRGWADVQFQLPEGEGSLPPAAIPCPRKNTVSPRE